MEQAPTYQYFALPWNRGHTRPFYMSGVALDAKGKLYRIFEDKGSGESHTNSKHESCQQTSLR